jgi:hypothetical protein
MLTTNLEEFKERDWEKLNFVVGIQYTADRRNFNVPKIFDSNYRVKDITRKLNF